MDPRLRRIRQERDNCAAEMKSMLDVAEGEKRDLNADESQRFEERARHLDALDERIRELSENAERTAALEKALAEMKITDDDQLGRKVSEDIKSLRGLQEGTVRNLDLTAPIGIVAPGKRGQRASLAVGSAATGGNLVPTTLVGSLYEALIETTSVFTWSTVITTASGEAMDFPKTANFSSATLTSEAAAISQSDPTFGKVTLNAHKYALLMQASMEFLQDDAVGVLDFLARQAARAIRNGFGAHAVNGDGSSKPNGIVGAATAGVTGAGGAGGAFTADNLIDLMYSVISEYRMGASWLMEDASLGSIRKLKDGAGQYVWQPAFAVGAPDLILGKPVFTDPSVPAIAADARSVVFGDLSAYYVRQVSGIRVERSDDFAFNTDEATWRVIWRGDGDLVDTTGAVKAFVGGAA